MFHNDFMKHEDHPIDRVMDAIRRRPDVTFQALTKRPWNAAEYFLHHEVPGNLWMGTSVESRRWIARIRYLKMIDAPVRFLSCEPLLEDLTQPDRYSGFTIPGITGEDVQWVIVEAESGNGRRPFSTDWALHLRDFCESERIAFFYKQGSDFKPGQKTSLESREYIEFPVPAGDF